MIIMFLGHSVYLQADHRTGRLIVAERHDLLVGSLVSIHLARYQWTARLKHGLEGSATIQNLAAMIQHANGLAPRPSGAERLTFG